MKAALLVVPFAVVASLVAVACSSTSTPQPSTNATPADAATDAASDAPATSTTGDAASAASCGLALYPADYPAMCQVALDKSCCAEERACGADTACASVVDCLAKCPAPRQDACTNACFPMGVPTTFDALGRCSKNATFEPDAGSSCSYP